MGATPSQPVDRADLLRDVTDFVTSVDSYPLPLSGAHGRSRRKWGIRLPWVLVLTLARRLAQRTQFRKDEFLPVPDLLLLSSDALDRVL